MMASRSKKGQPPQRSAWNGIGFVVLVLIGLVVHFFWWFLAVAVVVALFFIVRKAAQKRREALDAAARREAEISARADRQNHWTLLGDSRGVYGSDGAKTMRSVTPDPQPGDATSATGVTPRCAAVVYTAADLTKLVKEKLPCWRWALFASVLVQRREKVLPRLRDRQLRYPAPKTVHAHNGSEVRRLATECMNESATTVKQVEELMLTPAFMGMFGDPADESTADAGGVMQAANRLMDLHERLLDLAERLRGVTAPDKYSALLDDCNRMLDAPLEGYQRFIDDFVERVGEMPQLLSLARTTRGDVIETDPIRLHIDVDDPAARRIRSQLRKLMFFEWVSALQG